MKIITFAVLDMESLSWVHEESHEYEGAVALCCGPTSSETNLANSESNLSAELKQDFTKEFGQQQDILDQLNHSLSPIVAAGPNQEDFSAPEVAALNTEALDTTAGNYANAARAAGTALADRGGGTATGPESGVDAQIKGQIAAEAAGQLSGEELGITKANYDTGRQNYFGAESALADVGSQYNPATYANEASGANSSAFGEEAEIQRQKAQKMAAIGSLVGTGLSAFTGMGGVKGIKNLFGGNPNSSWSSDPSQWGV